MKEKKLFYKVFGCICLLVLLAGCGSSYDKAAGSSYTTSDAYAPAEMATDAYLSDYNGAEYEEAAEIEVKENANTNTNRKLIKTVNLSVETQAFDNFVVMIENRVSELGGYIENMESYNGSGYRNSGSRRYSNMTIRIPKDKLDLFVDDVSDASNIVRRNESVEDVTLSYVDLESHKKSLKVEQDRLLELMEQAEDLEDILVLENRLSEIRYSIESMEAQLRTYDNKVDYSTIHLNVDEVEVFTPVVEETVFERISTGFVQSLKDVGDGLVDFAVWFIVNIPHLFVWAVIIFVIVMIVRAIRKANKKRKEKRMAQRMTQGNAQVNAQVNVVQPVEKTENKPEDKTENKPESKEK